MIFKTHRMLVHLDAQQYWRAEGSRASKNDGSPQVVGCAVRLPAGSEADSRSGLTQANTIIPKLQAAGLGLTADAPNCDALHFRAFGSFLSLSRFQPAMCK